MDFYDVKTRKKVSIPDADLKKVKYTQKNGQVRYALRAYTKDGRKLTKFCSKETWDKMKVPEEKG